MNFYVCDMCHRIISGPQPLRYVVKIEAYAAYDPLEVTEEDLKADIRGEIRELLQKMSDMDEQELADGVYKKMEFDLCPACHEAYIKDPFFRKRREVNAP